MTLEAGGAGGIRTLDTVLPYTHFPGERLRPLGHRSAIAGRRASRGLSGSGQGCRDFPPPLRAKTMTPAERLSGRPPSDADIEAIARRTLDGLPSPFRESLGDIVLA